MRIGRDGPIRPLAPRIRVSLLRRPPGAYGAVVWRQIATGADPGQNGPLLRASSPASWQPCSVERVGVRSIPNHNPTPQPNGRRQPTHEPERHPRVPQPTQIRRAPTLPTTHTPNAHTQTHHQRPNQNQNSGPPQPTHPPQHHPPPTTPPQPTTHHPPPPYQSRPPQPRSIPYPIPQTPPTPTPPPHHPTDPSHHDTKPTKKSPTPPKTA